jgi:hypothetical protein
MSDTPTETTAHAWTRLSLIVRISLPGLNQSVALAIHHGTRGMCSMSSSYWSQGSGASKKQNSLCTVHTSNRLARVKWAIDSDTRHSSAIDPHTRVDVIEPCVSLCRNWNYDYYNTFTIIMHGRMECFWSHYKASEAFCSCQAAQRVVTNHSWGSWGTPLCNIKGVITGMQLRAIA